MSERLHETGLPALSSETRGTNHVQILFGARPSLTGSQCICSDRPPRHVIQDGGRNKQSSSHGVRIAPSNQTQLAARRFEGVEVNYNFAIFQSQSYWQQAGEQVSSSAGESKKIPTYSSRRRKTIKENASFLAINVPCTFGSDWYFCDDRS